MSRGFGSDSRFTSLSAASGGFGSPSVVGTVDVLGGLGFGSPSNDWLAQAVAVSPWAVQHTNYPEEGGVLVRLYGEFPRSGPWVVRITSDAGDTFYPSGQVGCYSGVIGQAHLCYTDRFRRTLVFVLPFCPEGLYDIWLDDPSVGLIGANIITDALRIVPRNQSEEVYSVRRTFPSRYKTAARGWSLESATLPTLPTAPLETLTRAMGQTLQMVHGSPQTRLVQPLGVSDGTAYVESTLGFPTGGSIWVGPRKYTYTFVGVPPAAPRFTGLVLASSSDGTELPIGTEVTCDVTAIIPD